MAAASLSTVDALNFLLVAFHQPASQRHHLNDLETQNIMRNFPAILTAFLTVITLTTEGKAQQSSHWQSEYMESGRADQVSVCIASTERRDGYFLLRLYGDTVDFMFANDSFTLPYGSELGVVALIIDGQRYILFANTVVQGDDDTESSTDFMFLNYYGENIVNIINALRWGTRARLEFPNGSSYGLSLSGSNNAILAAINCWEANQTGVHRDNPFESGSGQSGTGGVNPFSDL